MSLETYIYCNFCGENIKHTWISLDYTKGFKWKCTGCNKKDADLSKDEIKQVLPKIINDAISMSIRLGTYESDNREVSTFSKMYCLLNKIKVFIDDLE